MYGPCGGKTLLVLCYLHPGTQLGGVLSLAHVAGRHAASRPSHVLVRDDCLPGTRLKSSTAPFGSRRFPDGLEAASAIAHSKRGIRRCPIEKEAQGGKGKSGDREQAVRLPHQKVWMAMEGDGEDRGRSARGEVPHLRRDAHGPGLRVAHPVGGMGERMRAPGGA